MSHSPKAFAIGNVTNESKATMFSNPTFTGTVSGVTAAHVGLGNVTNESKATMFSSPTFTGTVSGVTASHVGLGNVTNESKATMFTNPTFTGTVSGVTASHVGLGTTANAQFGSLGIGTAASGTSGEIRATNNITGYYTSDRNLKENIRNIDSALGKLKQLNGVYFDWKQSYIDQRGGEDGYFVRKADTGVIAQEVEAVLPEIVGTRGDGTKAVAYEKFAGLLIEAIKELDTKVEDIKKHLGI